MKVSLYVFHRDLRLRDNVALYRCKFPIFGIYVHELDELDDVKTNPRQAKFVRSHLATHLPMVRYVKTLRDVAKLELNIGEVVMNGPSDSPAVVRVNDWCASQQPQPLPFRSFNDIYLIQPSDRPVGKDGTVYKVFSYFYERSVDDVVRSARISNKATPRVAMNRFAVGPYPKPSKDLDVSARVERYDQKSIFGTTRLSVCLRFGLVSPHVVLRAAVEHSKSDLVRQLIWREFYAANHAYFRGALRAADLKLEGRRLQTAHWKSFLKGTTSHELIDAGVREMTATGWCANRVRLNLGMYMFRIGASLEMIREWFAERLIDHDDASNIGNVYWFYQNQYKRFNPELQRQKYDPERKYVTGSYSHPKFSCG